jgi:hypothetical protein
MPDGVTFDQFRTLEWTDTGSDESGHALLPDTRAVAGNIDAFTASARTGRGLELPSAGLRDHEMCFRYRLCRLAERSSRMILTGRLVVTAMGRCDLLSDGMPCGFEHCEKPERQSREETYQCSD